MKTFSYPFTVLNERKPYSIDDMISDFIKSEFENDRADNIIVQYFKYTGHFPDLRTIMEMPLQQYPAEIEPNLIVIKSLPPKIGLYKGYQNVKKLAKLAELSGYNLHDLPILLIDEIIDDIKYEELNDFYIKITHRYSGSKTKAAPRE